MILSALGSLVSGFAAMQQASYQAAIADANALQAKYNAELSSSVAQKNAVDIGNQGAGMYGELVSAQGASGIAIGSPSLSRARIWQTKVGYQDQTRTIEAGNAQYANYMTESSVHKAEAASARSAAGFAMLSGVIGAFSSFAGSAQPSSMSPGFLPISTTRNRYYTAMGTFS